MLNAFPLSIPDKQVDVLQIPYIKETLDELRSKFSETHFFKRSGDKILIISSDGVFPVEGELKKVNLEDDLILFLSLTRDSLIRFFKKIKRSPSKYNPIEIISTRPDENILNSIINGNIPFKIVPKYVFYTRIINKSPFVIIDSSTCRITTENCQFFHDEGFNLVGRYIVPTIEEPDNNFAGIIKEIDNGIANIQNSKGELNEIPLDKIYLKPSRVNFDDYIIHLHATDYDIVQKKIREAVSSFNSGTKKKEKIDVIKKYLQKNGLDFINGSKSEIGESFDIQTECKELQKPLFIFNDNYQDNWPDQGLNKSGPYTKRTFDRNDPSICVICAERDKGRVEQFVNKLLKGIRNSKYFESGLEGKFSIGNSQTKIFTTRTDSPTDYRKIIGDAIKYKRDENGGLWDLALVEVRQSFKDLSVESNPYYVSKNLFLMHQIPVQDFTMELVEKDDKSLGYALSNMALACYAKMGGIPWLLKSSPTIAHELVIGIGSANIGTVIGKDQRLMGITTVFSGDGNYILSDTSKAVKPQYYYQALTDLLSEKIDKVKSKMGWQNGDTIRLVFHSQIKKFNCEEIEAVKALISKYENYQIEYAFLKISEKHGLQMFDSTTLNVEKGKLAPKRGKTYKLSDSEMLIFLTGQAQLRQITDGHPHGLILEIHKESTFKDLTYLSSQLYNFSAHSWRTFLPSPMPVTISYSNLIAQNLGWLNKMPDWNESIIVNGKIGQSQWFL